MRVQRTRSSPSALRSPLTRYPLDGHIEMVRTIEVTEYDIAWTRVFDEEAMALKVIFGDSLVTIHHIGSTAIPGLLAKPIIDVLVVIKETKTIERFGSAMEQLGYRVRGECLGRRSPWNSWALLFQQRHRRRAQPPSSRLRCWSSGSGRQAGVSRLLASASGSRWSPTEVSNSVSQSSTVTILSGICAEKATESVKAVLIEARRWAAATLARDRDV